MKRGEVLFILLFFQALTLWGTDSFTAQVFRQGQAGEGPLFLLENESVINGESALFIHKYYSMDGNLFAEERLESLESGKRVHSTVFYEIGEYSRLEWDGDKIEITFRRGEEEKSKIIDNREDLLFGPTQQQLIRDRYEDLAQGDKVFFSLPVPEFTTTASFYFRKVEGSEYEKEGFTVLEMKSNNIIVNLFIDRVFYVIDDSTKLIREIHGPSLLREKNRDKWVPINVDIFFSYK